MNADERPIGGAAGLFGIARPNRAPLRRGLAAFAVLYALTGGIALVLLPRLPASLSSLPDWIAVPPQLLAMAIAARFAGSHRDSSGYPRRLWRLIGAFCAMSLVATFVWNEWRVRGSDRVLSVADLCYFVDYALLSAAYCEGFRRYGGRLLSLRTSHDALTILVALLGTFWATLLGPFSPPGQSQPMGLLFGGAYAVSISVMLTLALLLFQRLPRRRRRLELLLIGAGVAEFLGELAWQATWLEHLDFLGDCYNLGDLVCFTLIVCAGACAPPDSEPAAGDAPVERNTDTFVPALFVLISAGLVAVFLATTRAVDAWILVGLVALAACLLTTRQIAVRREVTDLNRAIALRAANERVTELVRESADAFLVVDRHGIVQFASPASERILHVAPERLPGRRAAGLLGLEHESALSEFLDRLAELPQPHGTLELTVGADGSSHSVIRMAGVNQLANPLIRGFALTLSDVSALRKLEREVLEVSNQERMRLAGDIHDGLGQQLTGITMMLQGVATMPDPDPAKHTQYLQMIVGHLADAIRMSRDLARGLSPMYVVGGSLRGALQSLRMESTSMHVRVDVDPRFDDRIVGDFPADHLFRIAQEAVLNAHRHSRGTTTTVSLRVSNDHLALTIADDGCGFGESAPAAHGIGLRLMEYRARVIGGAFAVGPGDAQGTVVRVSVPVRYVRANREIA